jgi:hypothetical protein
MTIYYVGVDIAPESQFRLWHHFGSTIQHPHITLAYSREWFEYKPGRFYPLVIEPPFELEILRDLQVLRMSNSRLSERHLELRNSGAAWDFDDFRMHLSISPAGMIHTSRIPNFPIIAISEYYRTWLP